MWCQQASHAKEVSLAELHVLFRLLIVEAVKNAIFLHDILLTHLEDLCSLVASVNRFTCVWLFFTILELHDLIRECLCTWSKGDLLRLNARFALYPERCHGKRISGLRVDELETFGQGDALVAAISRAQRLR